MKRPSTVMAANDCNLRTFNKPLIRLPISNKKHLTCLPKVPLSPSDLRRKSELGQYMTPSSIADFMASLFQSKGQECIRLLDPGAGLGALSTAFVRQCFEMQSPPKLEVIAYEVDSCFKKILETGFKTFEDTASQNNLFFASHVIEGDFIEKAVQLIQSNPIEKFSHAILNPPYKKMHSQSKHKKLLQAVNIETVNLYTAFLALALSLLADKGELVAIVPRSFCSGSYYKSFRNWILHQSCIHQIHLFHARDKAFQEDGVLQENVILHLQKGGEQKEVVLSFSNDDTFHDYHSYSCPFEKIVHRHDEELFIRIPSQNSLIDWINSPIRYSIPDIGVEVSTGPIVDFRFKDFLVTQPTSNTVPLLYPSHFTPHGICWPNEATKKPNAIQVNPRTEKFLWPNGFYVVVRRMSSKEEKRRIIASVVDPNHFKYPKLGFENHLNVFHFEKRGLDRDLAYGLSIFLNSTQVDHYFRSFNGHTQVNATDLRSLKYPNQFALQEIGRWAQIHSDLSQEDIDQKIHHLKSDLR